LTMADERKRSFKTVDNVKKAGLIARFFYVVLLTFSLTYSINKLNLISTEAPHEAHAQAKDRPCVSRQVYQ